MINEVLEKISKKNEEIIAVHGKSEMSISAVLGMVAKPFDKDGVAKKTYDKHFNNPDSQYYQMTVEQILKVWEDKAATSCEYGKKLDTYIQESLVGNDLELWKLDTGFDWDERLKGICTGFDEFYQWLNANTDYVDVGGEIPLLYEHGGALFNGRLDRLFYSPSKNKYLIVDWKNTADITTSNSWQKLLGPLMKYDDCTGNTYTLQTQFYKTALINTYTELNITEDSIDTMVVQMLHGESVNVHYNIHNPYIPYSKTNIDNMCDFAWRKKQLMNK